MTPEDFTPYYDRLCGGCQAWGHDPRIRDGVCDTCDRTHDEIAQRHGVVELNLRMKALIFAKRADEAGQ